MPRVLPRELTVGTVQLPGPRRSLDHPIDSLGRFRYRTSLVRDDADPTAAGESDATASGLGFRGHAAMFDKRTWIGSKRWGFWEEIARGAFARTLANGADVRFLVNHDPNLVLARTKAGTLRLAEDEVGLAVDADMADVSYARDLAILLARGDVSQMSFAFVPVAWEYTEAEDGNDLYRITEVELFDVAAVTYPAYEDTDAGLRSRGFERLAERLGLDDDARRLVLGGSDEDVDRALSRGNMTTVDVSDTVTSSPPPPERMEAASPPAESTGIDPAALRHRAMRERRMAMTMEMM